MTVAKAGYKIAASLDQNHLDRMINLSSNPNSPLGLISVKTLLAYIATGAFVGLCFKLGMYKGNGFVFNVIYIGLTFLFVSRLINTTRTGELSYTNLTAMTDYIPNYMRKISTTRNSAVNTFYQTYGIANVDDKTGDIRYLNGDFGALLSVSGSGSILVFEEDQSDIIDAADNFWRKIDVGMQITQITIKEGQRVDLQLGNYQRRWDRIAASKMDKGTRDLLGDLMDAEVGLLANDVSMNYRSIHQYWLLRTRSSESLKSLKNLIKHDIENSGLMIKMARTQYYDDIVRVSKSMFSS